MKKAAKGLLGFMVYALTTLVIVSAMGLFWLSEEFSARGPLQNNTLITISKGSGLNSIAAQLERENVIDHQEVFVITARLLRSSTDLQAGEFEIKAGASPKDVLLQLRDGQAFARQVTVQEGLTSHEVVALLNSIDTLSGEIENIPEEGSLLPATYSFQTGEKRTSLIGRMQKTATMILSAEWDRRADNLPFETKEDALILASIIEKETGKPGEHARVSGVFINRLRIGMKLQTDPTVIYALTGGAHDNDGHGPLGRRLLRKDLGFDSPYNTYLYAGLPPGPIANPGAEAIRAALNPEDHNYLYFVADGTGGHMFAKTLKEHNRNAAKWRKIRAAQ